MVAEGGPCLVLRDHYGKAELLQRIAHGAGVVDRLLQLGNVAIVVVADNQRDALFRLRGGGKRHQGSRHAGHCQKSGNQRIIEFPARTTRPPPMPATLCRSRHSGTNGSIGRPGSGLGSGDSTGIHAKTLSFSAVPAAAPLTLGNSALCSGLTRPGIETRYLE
jgi:hypothetical protein